jgi:hypothetical protein
VPFGLLPGDKTDKLLRDEAYLDGKLYRAMDQLERLQRQRRGETVPPPLISIWKEGDNVFFYQTKPRSPLFSLTPIYGTKDQNTYTVISGRAGKGGPFDLAICDCARGSPYPLYD